MSCRASHGSGLKSVWTWVTNRSSARKFSVTSRRRDVQKPYYITTPIFYPNSDPHLGHLYSTVIADILVRYSVLKGPRRPVVFVTGTDEHGAKIQKAARIAGMEGREQEFCDNISAKFHDLAKKSNLSHTRFIRTTEPEHVVAVQHLWELIEDGTPFPMNVFTPRHKSNPSPTINSARSTWKVEYAEVSRETRNIVEWSEEENYKFRLSAFRELLLQRYHTDTTALIPREQHDLVLGLLNMPDNTADISVSRPSARLKWGIPVPDDPTHTIYVWLDALAAYLSAVGYPWADGVTGGKPHGWPPDVQIIGKDILRFHAIYFPAFLMALGLPLPKTTVSHAHLTVEREKMSKSVGNTADPFAILGKYDTDVVRYYLARIGGKYDVDKDWSETQLLKFQHELFSNLGNLFSRAFSHRVVNRLPESERYISIKPEIFEQAASRAGHSPGNLHSLLKNLVANYSVYMDELKISRALDDIVRCLGAANREYTNVAPWLETTSVDDISTFLPYIRETLRICGILMQPFIPFKAQMLLDELGVPRDRRTLNDAEIGKGELPGDTIVGVKPTKLFDSPRSQEDTEPKQGWMNF